MSRDDRLRVGVAQVQSVPLDIQVNLGKHIEMIRAARADGIEVLVFPELSLTGYLVGEEALDLALDRDDPLLAQLAQQAPDMTVVLGFIEEGPAAQIYNATVALKQGRCAFIHRKINLASYGQLEEDKYFGEGRHVDTLVHRPPWTLAPLICADVWNPALVHLAALHGATVLVTPIASSMEAVGGDFSNPRGWTLACSFYAMMYGMPVVMANHCCTDRGHRFWGGSRIVDPHGNPLAVAGDSETLIAAELDYGVLRRARFQLPTVRDSNLDLIHREIERMANRLNVPQAGREA